MLAFQYWPFIICYVVFPLAFVQTFLNKANAYKASRNWIDLLFAALLVLIIPALINTRRNNRNWFIILGGCSILLIRVCLEFALTLSPYQFSANFELKPWFYLIFSAAWLHIFPRFKTEKVIDISLFLSVFIIFELFYELFQSGRLLRPLGTGEVNYDAFLLLLSYVCALHTKGTARWKTALIFLGILSTFSRTGVLISILVTLIFSKSRVKWLVVAFSVPLFLLTFFIRNLETSVDSIDRFWMWKAFWELSSTHFGNFFFGYSIFYPLPDFVIPHNLMWLFESQREGWDLQGFYPFNFHAFWIRFSLTWGIVGVVTYLYALYAYRKRSHRKQFSNALILIVIAAGFTMGVFYLSNVSIPLLLIMLKQLEDDPDDGSMMESDVHIPENLPKNYETYPKRTYFIGGI